MEISESSPVDYNKAYDGYSQHKRGPVEVHKFLPESASPVYCHKIGQI